MLVRLSMDRTPDQSDFDANDRRLVASLAKHLANGLQLRSTFQATCISNRFYQEALDQLGISAIFINAAGQVVHTNHTAMSLLERKHGLCLRRGKLAVSEGRSGDKLRALVRSLLGPDNQGPQGMCLLDEQGNTLVQIVGRSLPGHDTPDLNRPTAVLLVTPYRNAASEPSAELIRDLFGLTEREARIAGLLTQGYDMHEAAVVLEVSVNTVKTHLRGIFVKMGYNNQAQVISALQNSAVRLL
jgi:DNA-binding CsgD family transcriptional regulator